MPGRHDLVAALHTSTGPLVSSPIAVWVLPADWGETKDGLRFRLAATHGNWQVGQRPAVHLFVQNVTDKPLVMHVPDWDQMKLDQHDDLLVLNYPADAGGLARIPPHGLWTQPVENPLLLAPGTYRVRLVYDAPEFPQDFERAWFGRLVSNDMKLEVRKP